MSRTVSHGKAAITLCMDYYYIATLRLAKMQDQWCLTLHWCSFSGWSWKHAATVFATKGSQYLIYAWLQRNRQSDYPRCTVKNRWHSVDDHFQNAAVTVWFTLLPTMADSRLDMDSTDHVPIQLPYFQNQQLLTLHLRSFLGGSSDIVSLHFCL